MLKRVQHDENDGLALNSNERTRAENSAFLHYFAVSACNFGTLTAGIRASA